MTQNVLITGISGFVGSHLADLVLEKGFTVYGLKRWHLSKMRNVRGIVDKINWIDCDITDPISVKNALKTSNPDNCGSGDPTIFKYDFPPSKNSEKCDVNFPIIKNLQLEAQLAQVKLRQLLHFHDNQNLRHI